MRALLIVVVFAGYYFGLSPACAVPLLFALGLLGRAPRITTIGPGPRRGGYIRPPASSTTNHAAPTPEPILIREATSRSNTEPGDPSTEWETLPITLTPSSAIGPGSSTAATGEAGANGKPPHSADLIDVVRAYNRAYTRELERIRARDAQAWQPWPRDDAPLVPPCGCGDTPE